MITPIMGPRLPLLFSLLLSGASLSAHTVPTIKVEAEFTREHRVTLSVDVDARLFLAPVPTMLPPTPASWWFDQSEEQRVKSMAQARAYVAKTLFFTVGEKKFEPAWEVVAIDSNTILPLAPTSAEAHLLCEYQGEITDAPGGFQVRVAQDCAVDVILLNSVEGDDHRSPQALFPGEKSRKFPLPEKGGERGEENKEARSVSETVAPTSTGIRWVGGAVLLATFLVGWALKRARGTQSETGKVS